MEYTITAYIARQRATQPALVAAVDRRTNQILDMMDAVNDRLNTLPRPSLYAIASLFTTALDGDEVSTVTALGIITALEALDSKDGLEDTAEGLFVPDSEGGLYLHKDPVQPESKGPSLHYLGDYYESEDQIDESLRP